VISSSPHYKQCRPELLERADLHHPLSDGMAFPTWWLAGNPDRHQRPFLAPRLTRSKSNAWTEKHWRALEKYAQTSRVPNSSRPAAKRLVRNARARQPNLGMTQFGSSDILPRPASSPPPPKRCPVLWPNVLSFARFSAAIYSALQSARVYLTTCAAKLSFRTR
jgi:hypothetical protein